MASPRRRAARERGISEREVAGDLDLLAEFLRARGSPGLGGAAAEIVAVVNVMTSATFNADLVTVARVRRSTAWRKALFHLAQPTPVTRLRRSERDC